MDRKTRRQPWPPCVCHEECAGLGGPSGLGPLTFHLKGSQARNQPVKVGGSCPCFTTIMGVSRSRPLGWVLRYSCTVVAAAFFSSSLAFFPIQKKTCGASQPESVSPVLPQLTQAQTSCCEPWPWAGPFRPWRCLWKLGLDRCPLLRYSVDVWLSASPEPKTPETLLCLMKSTGLWEKYTSCPAAPLHILISYLPSFLCSCCS